MMAQMQAIVIIRNINLIIRYIHLALYLLVKNILKCIEEIV